MEKVLLCWSGGKDSAMALYETQKDHQYEVVSLLTTITKDYDRVSLHGVRRALVEQQAKSLGLPLEEVFIPKDCPNQEYESKMRDTLTRFKQAGVNLVAFGDVFLEEVREYRPGDDIRHIDWPVTARMNKPYVKEYREERELTVVLLVDVSSSGAFGSVSKLKNEVAAEVAAILAYTAIKSNDKVGLIIFSDRIERYIPPKKGRAHVWRVIREILTFRPERRRLILLLPWTSLASVSASPNLLAASSSPAFLA